VKAKRLGDAEELEGWRYGEEPIDPALGDIEQSFA
jgi:hypothetical protein